MENEKRFSEVFQVNAERSYFSPGRVNLIGEHTDYNGGNVFPCALTIGTYGVVSLRKDSMIRMYSENFHDQGVVEFNLSDLTYNKAHDWANYPKGVIAFLRKEGYLIDQGMNIYFYGNIPNGAGLSSSASIEVLTAYMMKDLFQLEISMIDLVKLCQKVENEFMGVNSGIMDQFAVAMGKKDQAILLDTNTLEYRYSPVLLENASLVVSNTNKKRGLADSKYNERRAECEEALRRLQTVLPIASLGEIDSETFGKYQHVIQDEVLIKRAKHAVTENERTLLAVKALESNEIEEFGKLMNASHESLREDYEVTGVELDTLVELGRKVSGTIGSRMTGAGFGGCTVSIVQNDAIDRFIQEVGTSYEEIIGYEAEFYVVSIGDGVHKLS
ncbi:galactokinase [Proteiniclasticum ruminis]|uniref:Galactokinase n=1 Tax=Proteiniclasticum ruminis TaxID=398199 RepID=A0A1I5F688_9CLOT|nr:galactokinase [Proteiniclasticum ruminis]SFO18831.1 galactokinase [Proteiniclasticum ruminis]